QRGNEPGSIVEAQRLDLHGGLHVLGPWTVWVIGERAHTAPFLEQPPGDEPPRIAESSGDRVDAGLLRLLLHQKGKRVRSSASGVLTNRGASSSQPPPTVPHGSSLPSS